MPYTVKKFATISRDSVRTLHLYDQIGLLSLAKLNRSRKKWQLPGHWTACAKLLPAFQPISTIASATLLGLEGRLWSRLNWHYSPAMS